MWTMLEVNIDWAQVWNTVWNWCKTDGLKLVVSLVVLFIAWKIVNVIFKKLAKFLEKRKTDKTLTKVGISLGRKIIKAFLLLMFISYIGIDTSSIVAAITAGAVTVGLALQGALSNLASGVLIIILRPFRVGDFIECDGQSGTVDEIGLFQTRLITGDNKVVIIPNSCAIDDAVINYSLKNTRRVDMVFSIAYENDFRKAKRIIANEIKKTKLTLEDPAPFINITAHSASSIDITARAWVKSEDYWNYYWMMMESVKLAFDKNGISIPYSQMDIHMIDNSTLPNPNLENDPLVLEEIEAHKKRLQSIYEAKAQREKELQEEIERQEKKDIVKVLAKKRKQKSQNKKEAQKKK